MLVAIAPAAAMLCDACGGAGGSAAANPSSRVVGLDRRDDQAPRVRRRVQGGRWSAAVTVGFADSCTMTLATTASRRIMRTITWDRSARRTRRRSR